MKKIRRLLSVIVVISMMMSISSLCYTTTAVTVTRAATVQDGSMWKLENYISIGEVGSTVATSNAPFGLDQKGKTLSTTVVEYNGVASVVNNSDGKRAFSKSSNGIIDITPSDGQCSQVYFTAPVAGNYYFEAELEKTDMSNLPAGTYVNNWTEVGPRTSLGSTYRAFGVTAGVNYTGAAIGNDSVHATAFTATSLSFTGKVTLTAGQVIVISVDAGNENNTDETQTTVKKFNVVKASSNATLEDFACSIGTPDALGDIEVGNFKLGTMYNGRPFEPVNGEMLVNGWGDPLDENGVGATEGYWGWSYYVKSDDHHYPLFISPQTASDTMDMSPKYGLPSIIIYTAQNDGLYCFDAEFEAIAAAVGVKLTVATGAAETYRYKTVAGAYEERTEEYRMSMSEPNFLAESQVTTASSIHNFDGIVELKAGQSIWFVAENNLALISAEVGVIDLSVTYLAEHVCHEFEGADCQKAGTCVLCGAKSGTTDTATHVSDTCTYTNNGNGTHIVTHTCCNTHETVAHDFTSGTCACGAEFNVNSADYVASLAATSWVAKGETVEVDILISGSAGVYASGQVVIGYDPNIFTFDQSVSEDELPSDMLISPASTDGRIILIIVGDPKTFASGLNTIATLYFTAAQSTDASDIVLENAGFSTSILSKNSDLVPAEKYNDVLTISTADVTVSNNLSVYQYSNLNEKSMYLITNDIDKLPEGLALMIDVDGEGAEEPVPMYWSDEYNAYCYLIVSDQGAPSVNDFECTAAQGYTNSTINYGMDVNLTNEVDANDAQLVYDIYMFEYSSFDDISMDVYLSADVNCNKNVGIDDVSRICEKVCNDIKKS